MNILVSRCLLGDPCRYDGKSKPVDEIRLLQNKGYTLIPVCPEVLGGLDTPRSPAEIQPDGRVINRDGADVTVPYHAGAQATLDLARRHHCTVAILKANSPSCGSNGIYDGTFSKRLVHGMGVAARILKEAGICVLDETQLNWLTEFRE